MVELGGDKGSRTPDLLNAIETLYQLSYIPTRDFERIVYHILGCEVNRKVQLFSPRAGDRAALGAALPKPPRGTASKSPTEPLLKQRILPPFSIKIGN